jgi:hypothetical protein
MIDLFIIFLAAVCGLLSDFAYRDKRSGETIFWALLCGVMCGVLSARFVKGL